MSDNPGWIALSRKFLESPLYGEKRVFSKAEAWIDILFNVRWGNEPQRVIIGNKVLICNRGESLKSLDTWAKRWGWSKFKVRAVLKLFESEKMIELKNETVTTRLIVVNYSKYQDPANASKTEEKRIENASKTHPKPEEQREHCEQGNNKNNTEGGAAQEKFWNLGSPKIIKRQVVNGKRLVREKENTNREYTDGFNRFWRKYPKRRKNDRKCDVFDLWVENGYEELADRACAALENHLASADWAREGGQFIPKPTNWIDRNYIEVELPPPHVDGNERPGTIGGYRGDRTVQVID